MLLYASAGISELEIPTKRSLVIYISNCQNKCPNCHTPFLQTSYGDILKHNFEDIFNLYYNYFDIVCFMGEGKGTNTERKELIEYCDFIHKKGKLAALYCGRNCNIESWMKSFDYIKIGSYQEKQGPLTNQNTNQKLYQKNINGYHNITYMFHKKIKKGEQ